jgi:hypothetical protein
MLTVLSKSDTYTLLARHHLVQFLPKEMLHVHLGDKEALGLVYHNGTEKMKARVVLVYLDRDTGMGENAERLITQYILMQYGWVNLYFNWTNIRSPSLKFIISTENTKVFG